MQGAASYLLMFSFLCVSIYAATIENKVNFLKKENDTYLSLIKEPLVKDMPNKWQASYNISFKEDHSMSYEKTIEDVLLRLISNKLKNNNSVTLSEEEINVLFRKTHELNKQTKRLNKSNALGCYHGFLDCPDCNKMVSDPISIEE